MGPLPAVRSRPARPFSCTELDYIVPFSIKASGGRGQKAFKGYVAIFIGMVVLTLVNLAQNLSSRSTNPVQFNPDRAKWLRPNCALKPGDLVLFKDELTPLSKWTLHPRVDGLSRVAAIRIAASEYKYPINKLILLHVNT
ncbi:hypothetical protein TSAR_002478 [Trichomalopsis sarcophagae]|uniref:DUF5641 domain-containing protein n=1 Tax=Trichomalopsis sarcophagae TaxID=543379 RepID=A0A232FBD6_9HYME|nr:hypothetical protein TSAR_002478 [Trichomalopsis sarcophagae]